MKKKFEVDLSIGLGAALNQLAERLREYFFPHHLASLVLAKYEVTGERMIEVTYMSKEERRVEDGKHSHERT